MLPNGGTVNSLKAQNLQTVMRILFASEGKTKLDIVQETGLSGSTVSDCVNRLAGIGIIHAYSTDKSMGGRRPAIYRVIPKFGVFVGLELRHTSVRATVTALGGQVLEQFERTEFGMMPAIHRIYQVLDMALARYSAHRTLAIGFGVCGHTDYEEGVILDDGATGWRNVHIKEIIERHYGVYTYVDHIVNCGAIYQKTRGKAAGLRNLLCCFDTYPEKAALFLDDVLCRSGGNHCLDLSALDAGLLEDPARLEQLGRLLTLDAVLVGRAAGPEEKQSYIHFFRSPEELFPVAAAVMAQLAWMEHLYDLA